MDPSTPRRSTRLQQKTFTPSRSTSSANESSAMHTPSTTSSSSSSNASVTPAPEDMPQLAQTTTNTTTATSYPKVPTKGSPFLPTMMESLLLALYPTTLLIGSLYATFDPATRASPYVMAQQSHDPAFAPSYFAKKSNLFNQIFVKRGWFWISLSYFFFVLTHSAVSGSPMVATKKRIQGALRWGVATTWWVLVTQWCFGPPIIDRGFTMTGGACEFVEMVKKDKGLTTPGQRFVSGMACKAHGGKWYGGHDISGHVFLLVLGSFFLFEEVLFAISKASRAKEERVVLMGNGEMKPADAALPVIDRVDLDAELESPWDAGVKVALCVGALSIWMLLMTAAYFHTWFEKVCIFTLPL